MEAKNKINSIFQSVQQYVEEAAQFLKGKDLSCLLAGAKSDHSIVDVVSYRGLIPADSIVMADQFCESVQTIRDVLARDHMKVVFFGRWVFLLRQFME